MPNTKSAIKRARTSEAARLKNKTIRTRVTNTRRVMLEVCDTNDKEKADQAFRTYCSVLDKAAKRGVLKKNTAIRRKRRASNKLTSMASAPEA